jgi:hypothetical protein
MILGSKSSFLTFLAVFVTVGGSFSLSAAQSAFSNRLIGSLATKLPDMEPAAVLGIGATQIHQAFTSSEVPLVLDSYMVGLKAVFAICVGAFGIATLIGLFGDWDKLHGEEAKTIVETA